MFAKFLQRKRRFSKLKYAFFCQGSLYIYVFTLFQLVSANLLIMCSFSFWRAAEFQIRTAVEGSKMILVILTSSRESEQVLENSRANIEQS